MVNPYEAPRSGAASRKASFRWKIRQGSLWMLAVATVAGAVASFFGVGYLAAPLQRANWVIFNLDAAQLVSIVVGGNVGALLYKVIVLMTWHSRGEERDQEFDETFDSPVS